MRKSCMHLKSRKAGGHVRIDSGRRKPIKTNLREAVKLATNLSQPPALFRSADVIKDQLITRRLIREDLGISTAPLKVNTQHFPRPWLCVNYIYGGQEPFGSGSGETTMTCAIPGRHPFLHWW